MNIKEQNNSFNLNWGEVIDNTKEPVIKPLTVTENGVYSAGEDIDGFSPVKVDVPLRYEEGYNNGYNEGYQASQDGIKLQEKTVIENGEVVTDDGFTGMSKVIVAVPIKEEQTKALDVTENGSYNILPDDGKVLSVASVNVNIPPKEEQEKTVEITANGTTEVVADEGKTLSKVTVNTNVAFEGDIGKPYIDTSKITSFSYFCMANRINSFVAALDTSNGTDFTYMFNNCNTLNAVPPLDTKNGTNFQSMFRGCSALTTIPQLDTKNGTNFQSMFDSCSALTTIPQLDTSKGTSFQNMFSNCRKLTSIPQLDTSKGTSFSYTFSSCSNLESVSLTTAKSNLSTGTFSGCSALKNITIGEGWAVNIYLHYSNNLTVESLHGMIENLADLTGQTAKTFQIGATNLAKIDEAHLTMLDNKNWNYS